jgi:Ca2+-binding RTX toxin-like protein
MLKKLFGVRSNTSHKPARRPLGVENLGDRIMPAVVNITFDGNHHGNGVLTIECNNDNDKVTLTSPGSAHGLILLNGQPIHTAGGTPTLANTRGITLDGFGGNDTLTINMPSWSGQASIHGGAGNDRLTAHIATGPGSYASLFGEESNDVLTGSTETDFFFGGDGVDTVVAQGNVDFTLTDESLTGLGTDALDSVERANLTGGAGNNTLDASAFSGNVTLQGLGGDDTLIGGSGNDSLYGGAGKDTLEGGDGNDYLDGGHDGVADVLVGGSGADFFKRDSVFTIGFNVNHDAPQDFNFAEGDRIVP